MKTSVYVDGFNLYYGSLKNTAYKWLNIDTLCKNILPDFNIASIKYFTARVKPSPDDPTVATRQMIYMRALKTIPHLEIIEGNFQTHPAKRLLVDPLEVLIENPFSGNKTPKIIYDANVLITSEKGSDVNLASNLLIDGISNNFEAAIVISNDSDLLTPIVYVKRSLKKSVFVLNPHPTDSRELKRFSSKMIKITQEHLAASQFEPTLKDGIGEFVKPTGW